MPMRVILPEAFVSVPWRNGGGTAWDIAEGGDREAWDWRLSLAEIARDGPFSLYPQIDRLLILLAGEGITLSLEDGPTQVLHPLDDLAFPGEAAMACRLLGGPARALNLMVNRRKARSVAGLVPCDGAERLAPADVLLVLALGNRVVVHVGTGRTPLPQGAVAVLQREGASMVQGQAWWARIEAVTKAGAAA
jgi:environmental stress-induced protein Ves